VELHPVVKVAAALTAVAAAVWTTWCNVIAFVGGQLPLLPWELEGGIVTGVVWLVVVDPLAIGVAWWGSLLILTPLAAIFRGRSSD
jgi:hypothetical protein